MSLSSREGLGLQARLKWDRRHGVGLMGDGSYVGSRVAIRDGKSIIIGARVSQEEYAELVTVGE